MQMQVQTPLSRPTAGLDPPQPLDWKSASLALLASALWGGNLVALKIGLEIFPPLWSAWWRFVLGVGAVSWWAARQGIPLWPQQSERGRLIILGLLFTAQIALLNLGVNLTSPAYGVVILNSHPIFANLAGHFVASEQRLNCKRVLGLGIAFFGVCYLAFGKPVPRLAPNPLVGNTLLIFSSFLLGIRTVYTRWLVQGVDPVKAVTWQMALSLPVFLVAALLLEPPLARPLALEPIVAMAYQGLIVAGICFVIWTGLLRRYSAGTLATFGFTVPLFGIALSRLLLGEPLDARIVVAAAAVITGIALVLKS